MGGQRARGTASILFTDLVGSTELMARLGDAGFDELRTAHFAALTAVIEASDGAVVKNTGDGLLATFASAVDALQAAVAVQQAADRQSRQGEVRLEIRVGMAVGEVGFDDGDVFGTPVVEAARLVAAARPGQILCTALVRAIAGSRAGVTFTDLDPRELRGLPDPVAVCEVAWEHLELPERPTELPPLFGSASRIFVGRVGHLERLRQRWKEVVAGERRLVLVGGEPGVGKTRLATALARDLHDEGAVVLAGRCDEDLGVPYQPVVEALRHYVSHASVPRLGRHRGELVRLVPELAQLVPDLPEPLRSDPETERYRLFDAVAAWLSEASAGTPVLLVVDDLHWAAKPTILLLRHVLRSPEPLRLLVVATYRDSDIGRGHPLADLMADVPRLEVADRLPLSGLEVPDVAAFLERAAGHELGDDGAELARTIWQETEGNAFFVTEVLRHLAESRAIEERDGRWVMTRSLQDLGVPDGVRDVVGRRLSRLSAEANRLLACASVVGLEFEPAVLVAASGIPEDAVVSALEEAIAARLVVETPGPVPRNRFSHALVRTTLYDELSAARRVALHRKVAEAIETVHGHHLDDHLPALSHHWARASAPSAETGRAVDYARRAGDRALAQFANDEAAMYYREALNLLDVARVEADDPRRLPLMIALGEAQRRGGDTGHRETLLAAADLARRLGDAGALARAALANSRGYIMSLSGAVDAERVAALEAALAAAPADDSAVRARLLSTLALELTQATDPERRVSLSDDALTIARRVGDPETIASVLIGRCLPTLLPDTLERRRSDTTELVALLPALRDPAQRARALVLAHRLAVTAGRIEEAGTWLDTADALAGELGEPALRWMTMFLQAGRAIMTGRFDEAERRAAEAGEVGEAGGQREASWAHAMQLFLIRKEQGRVDEQVRTVLARTAADISAVGAHINFVDTAVGLTELELGHVSAARVAFEAAVAHPSPLDFYSVVSRSLQSEFAVRLGETGTVEELYGWLLPHPEWVVPHPGFATRSVSFHLGLLASFLGRFDEADGHYASAVAQHEQVGAPTFLAGTRLEWARMLLSRGDPGDEARAQTLLNAALVAAREFGLVGAEREAAALLAQQ